MASLNNAHDSNPRFIDVPGRPDQVMGVWLLKMKSSSDTLTVPQLAANLDDTPAASNNDTIRILSDSATTVAAGATDSNNEVALTFSGASAGDELVISTLHPRDNRSTRVKDPA